MYCPLYEKYWKFHYQTVRCSFIISSGIEIHAFRFLTASRHIFSTMHGSFQQCIRAEWDCWTYFVRSITFSGYLPPAYIHRYVQN